MNKALRLEKVIADKAQERMKAGKAADPVQISAQGKTRDTLAAIAGVSHDRETITGLKYSFGTWPRCPSCRSVDLRRYRTHRKCGEESMSYAFCRVCGKRCVIIMRPSE